MQKISGIPHRAIAVMLPIVLLLAALLLTSVPHTALASSAPDALRVYVWSDYIPPEVARRFTEETGIPLHIEEYDSNEKMYARVVQVNGQTQQLSPPASGTSVSAAAVLPYANTSASSDTIKAPYDLIMPSTYYVSRMRKEGLLIKLSKEQMPRLVNLDPKILGGAFDPHSDYSIPYLWGITLPIAYSAQKTLPALNSWNDLSQEAFRNNVTINKDMRDVFSIGLMATGHSINSTSEMAVREAYQWIKQLNPQLEDYHTAVKARKMHHTGTPRAHVMYNSEAAMLQEALPRYAAFFPREGALLWADNMAIPQNARNVKQAHRFINFMLRPDISALVAAETYCSTPNLAAFEMLQAEMVSNPVITPSEQAIGPAEFQSDLGEARKIYEKYWEKLLVELKAQHR